MDREKTGSNNIFKDKRRDAEHVDFPHTGDFGYGWTRIFHAGQTPSRQQRERSEAHPCPSEYIRVNVRYAPAIRVLRVHPFVYKKNTWCGIVNKFFQQTDTRGGRGFSAHRDFAIGWMRISHVGQTSSRQQRERSEAHPRPSEYIRVNVRYAPAIRVLRVHPFVE